MKPYEKESKYQKYKAIDDRVLGTPPVENHSEKVSQIDRAISEIKDVSESKTNVILLSILLIPLCAYLIYIGSHWASLILVAWIGAVVFYFVNERAITLRTLTYKSQVQAADLVTKINYLLTWTTEKKDRIILMRTYNRIFWSLLLFVGIFILFPMNWGISFLILLLIAVGNVFFWTRFYQPQLDDLDVKTEQLEQIKNDVIMASHTPQKHLKRYANEEE